MSSSYGRVRVRTAALLTLVVPSAALAQTVRLPDVVVTGNPLGSELVEMVAPAAALAGETLFRMQQPTLGEIIATLPGLTSTYYGPNASRPVIRGLDGERVRILQNGLGTLDASGASVDHAVALDPLSASRIEVVRGPATLLYGPSALGGVVNVIDNRIPSERIDGVRGGVDLRYASPASERAVAGQVEVGHAGGLAVHIDGFRRTTDDLRIPGFAWSPRLRDARGEEGPSRTLPNSASDADGFTIGGGYVGSRGHGGASWNRFDTDYGTVADEEVTIRMRKQRFDATGEVRDPFAGAKAIRFRYARTDYEHTEVEGDEVGTVFRGGGFEARLEATHARWGAFEGVVGVQAIDSDFSAQGDEAFLPDTTSRLLSLFVFEEARVDDLRLQLGARYDRSRVRAADSETFGAGASRTFDTGSASAGFAWSLPRGATVVGSATYSQRPPSYQELFADGPHVATGIYEVGDRSLGVEKSLGLDVALRRGGGDWSGSIGAFYNRFHDYISLYPTGWVDADLPVYDYRAVKATFYGVELEGRLRLGTAAGGTWEVEGRADWLRATDDTNGRPLPRIAPARVGGAIAYVAERFDARVDVLRVLRQDRVADAELPTDAYTMVDLALAFRLPGDGRVSGFVKAVNLLDEDARTHGSLLKDIAPLGRRGVVAGVRGTFP
ncbi:MAG TPA: TonB-dependent receptor [Casimicrobiaceae bacterium]|nr:TonB-dependent receptor [Casimicrobiaceae bacterium]